jgi:alkanesulfonate monooxygenase SsuD/methylene tetrahydromethanopterin reductase-like flavin-dependent oxidoreductase (luciferase family)
MRLGIFTELQTPPFKTQFQAYHELMVQAEAAERMGFDHLYLAEHHFFPAFSSLANPLSFLTAIAQRTERIRLGTAVSLLPVNNPVRLAGEVAAVDILTNGRLDWGVGRGHPWMFEAFNVPIAESRERFEEALEIILEGWASDVFSYEGKFTRVRNLRITPKPVQKPHPPIHIAVTSGDSAAYVGRKGFHLMIPTQLLPLPMVKEGLRRYREEWEKVGHTHRSIVTATKIVYVARSREEAKREAGEAGLRFFEIAREAAGFLRSGDQALKSHYKVYTTIGADLGDLTLDEIIRDIAIFGSPEECIERILELQDETGFDGFSGLMNFGGLEHNKVMRSMELFAERVIPVLKKSL